jgi:hypothetical protein
MFLKFVMNILTLIGFVLVSMLFVVKTFAQKNDSFEGVLYYDVLYPDQMPEHTAIIQDNEYIQADGSIKTKDVRTFKPGNYTARIYISKGKMLFEDGPRESGEQEIYKNGKVYSCQQKKCIEFEPADKIELKLLKKETYNDGNQKITYIVLAEQNSYYENVFWYNPNILHVNASLFKQYKRESFSCYFSNASNLPIAFRTGDALYQLKYYEKKTIEDSIFNTDYSQEEQDALNPFKRIETFGDTSITQIRTSLSKTESLPDPIAAYQNLETIDCPVSALKSLPEDIGTLSKLTYLDLRLTFVQRLPESFGDLNALEYLDISNSRLSELPESFGKLPALKTLSMMNMNSMPQFPEVIFQLKNLKELFLSEDDLVRWNVKLTELELKMPAVKVVTY